MTNESFTPSRFRRLSQVGKGKTISKDRNSVWPEAAIFQALSGVEMMSLGPFLVPPTEIWPPGLHMLQGWRKEFRARRVFLLWCDRHEPVLSEVCPVLLSWEGTLDKFFSIRKNLSRNYSN